MNEEDATRLMKRSIEYIDKIKEDFGEWIEMSDRPQELLTCILVSKHIALQEYVEYLEKHLTQIQKEKHERSNITSYPRLE